MEPGAKVMTVDYHFLSAFYEFSEQTSLHIGNLVGYERGDNIVPVYLDVNKLVTEHLAVLAMTGAGKSYTVGRIIERLVASIQRHRRGLRSPRRIRQGAAQRHASVRAPRASTRTPATARPFREIQKQITRLHEAGAGILVYTPQTAAFRSQVRRQEHRAGAPVRPHSKWTTSSEILPGLTEPQQRVLDVAIRYWRSSSRRSPATSTDCASSSAMVWMSCAAGTSSLRRRPGALTAAAPLSPP